MAKESLDFVKIFREKIKKMGYEKKAYFSKLRQTYVEERVQIVGHVRKKEIGKFVPLAYSRIPPMDKTKWYWIRGMFEPEWTCVHGKEN